jgi:hypothetical protein
MQTNLSRRDDLSLGPDGLASLLWPSLVVSVHRPESDRSRNERDLVDDGLLTASLDDVDDEQLLRVSRELRVEVKKGDRISLRNAYSGQDENGMEEEMTDLKIELARRSGLGVEGKLGDVLSRHAEGSRDLLVPLGELGSLSGERSSLVGVDVSREVAFDVVQISIASGIGLVVVRGDLLLLRRSLLVSSVSISCIRLGVVTSGSVTSVLDILGEVLVDGALGDPDRLPLPDTLEIVLHHLPDLLKLSEDLVPDVETERLGQRLEDLLRGEVVLLEVLLGRVEVEEDGVGSESGVAVLDGLVREVLGDGDLFDELGEYDLLRVLDEHGELGFGDVIEDGELHRGRLGLGRGGHDELSETRDTEGDVGGSVT